LAFFDPYWHTDLAQLLPDVDKELFGSSWIAPRCAMETTSVSQRLMQRCYY